MRIERWRYALPLRLRSLLHRRDVERDLDDEIRDHIERQTAANLAAGMTPDEARRAALVAFGGVERVKDESRDVRGLSWIDHVAQLRHAARSLRQARTFTIASITTIALGIAAGSAVFSVVNAVLLRPLPYPHSDRLVGLWHSFPGIGMPLVAQAPGTYASYRESATSFESIGAYADGDVTITSDDPSADPEHVGAAGVAGSIFTMLGQRPLLGRVLLDRDERPGAPAVAVLGERYWRTRMNAAPDVIGRVIRVDGERREIVGVLPASFTFPGSDVQIWMPMRVEPGAYLGQFGLRAIARLRPGVSPAAAQRELQSILAHVPQRFAEVHPGMSTAAALARTEAVAVLHRMRDDAIGGFERILWLVAASVALLVIVAFSNVASLVLARAEARQREFAVRSTLGASAGRLWAQLVAESAILAVAGGAAGIAMAVGALHLLVHAGPTSFPDPIMANGGIAVLPRLDEIRPDRVLIGSALTLMTLFCATIVLIGAWRFSSADPMAVLRNGGRSATSGRASQRLRAAFVAIEVALSLVLLSGSAVLGRSVLRLLRVQPGFDPANVMTFWASPPPSAYPDAADVARFYRDASARIARMPDVVSVGVVSKPPLQFGQTRRPIWVEDALPPAGTMPPDYPVARASEGYFAAMGIPMTAGRSFDPLNIGRGVNEAVVSRGFVRRNWGDATGSRALGRRFRPGGDVGPWYTIVGVVDDVRDTSLTAPPEAIVYLPEEPGLDSLTRARTTRDMVFVVRTRGPTPNAAEVLKREMRAVDRTVPTYGFERMTDTVAKAGSRMRLVLLLLGAGAFATLTLGVVGLYGVIAYTVGMRSREIGIRIALGLTPRRAVQMMLGQGLAIAAGGAVVGALVFSAFATLLRTLVYDVSASDLASVAGSASIVFAVATVATWVPARRAARIDPVESLKSD